jgi:hypothetical protein
MGRNAIKLSLAMLHLATGAESIVSGWAYFSSSAGKWLMADLFS